jgi:hypothetical protein
LGEHWQTGQDDDRRRSYPPSQRTPHVILPFHFIARKQFQRESRPS